MIKGIADEAVASKLVNRRELDSAIEDLYTTANSEGTFCYIFFKGKAKKP